MKPKPTIRIAEQADMPTADGRPVYSWILDGITGHKSNQRRMADAGWKWIRGVGCRGVYATNDLDAAKQAANRAGATVVSNGTHALHRLLAL